MAGGSGVVPHGSDPNSKSLWMIQKRCETRLGDKVLSDDYERQCFKEEKVKKVTKIDERADSM